LSRKLVGKLVYPLLFFPSLHQLRLAPKEEEGGLNPRQTIAPSLLADDFLGPHHERDKDCRVGKTGMLADQIAF
jgi:hypothetical protein